VKKSVTTSRASEDSLVRKDYRGTRRTKKKGVKDAQRRGKRNLAGEGVFTTKKKRGTPQGEKI